MNEAVFVGCLLMELLVLALLVFCYRRMTYLSRGFKRMKANCLADARYSQYQLATLKMALNQMEPMFDWSQHTRRLKKAALVLIASTVLKLVKQLKSSRASGI